MKKILASAIALVLTTSVICIPCPVAQAALDPNDFVGTWYYIYEIEAGTFVNAERYINLAVVAVGVIVTCIIVWNKK